MKKTYAVQLIIDVSMVVFSLCLYLFPSVSRLSPNGVFYLTMGVYSGLALLEYIFDRSIYEPLCLFFASGTAAFSAFFLREYNANYVLSTTILVWTMTIAIIKIMYLRRIPVKKNTLFIIRLTSMSSFVLMGLLVGINLYFRVSTIGYMLGILYLSYGLLEIYGDYSSHLSEEGKLREYGSIRSY